MIREALRPLLERIIKNYLFSLRISPSEIDRVSIWFADVDMLGAKEKAEIGKIEAERLALIQSIYNEIRINDPAEAMIFAEEHNLFQSE